MAGTRKPEQLEVLRPLGVTNLQVTALTLGTSYLGDPAQPDGSPHHSAATLAEAMLKGPFAMIDTSNNYAQGRSETALGQAIANYGLPSDRMVVTKTDAEPGTGRFDRDRIWRSFEESSTRLGLETLPLVHLHDPFLYLTLSDAFGPGGAVQGMIELKDQGLVSNIGIAAGETSLLRQAIDTGVFDVLLTHNRYTIVDIRAEDLIYEAAGRGIGVFNAAPFGGGLLAGRGTRYAYRESPAELLLWLEKVKKLCTRWGTDLPTAALHFSLRNPLIHSTVVGISSSGRLRQLQDLAHYKVPEGFWPDLKDLGTPPSTLTD